MALYDSTPQPAKEEVEVQPDVPVEEPQSGSTAQPFVLGPSQEQLEATSDEPPYVPEVLKRAAAGEQVVTSLPVEEQGGDSLNPPNYDEQTDEPEKATDES